MTECIPHPDDPSRWLPVAEAVSTLWRDNLAALALIEGHDKRLDTQQASLTELTSRVTALEDLPGLVATLSTTLNDTVKALADLSARVDALPKPLPTGPAFGVDVGKDQTAAQVKAALQGKPDFCIINTTTGLATTSPALATNTGISRDWADLTGFYHWGLTVNASATTPDKSDPIGEARHFLDTAPLRIGDLVVLDNEQDLGTWQQKVAYDIAWLEFVALDTGAIPLNYKNWNWIQNIRTAATAEQWARWSAFPIWLADPSGTPGKHAWISPKAGTNTAPVILLHQYDVSNNLDHDWTPDIAGLRSLGVQYLAA